MTCDVLEAAAALRADLPGLTGRAYFNHAARGPLPGRVIEAVRHGLVADSTGEGPPGPAWRTVYDRTRERAARLIGASAGELAYIQNTSVGLSIAAASVRWKAGDNVVVSLAENPANLTPWMHLAEFGVETRCMPSRDACLDVEALLNRVDSRTRVVAVGAVEYTSGQRVDIARIGEFCRARDILFVVDGAQAVGAVPVNVKRAQVDILSSGAQKWIMAPIGIGFLFVDARLHESLRTPMVGEHAIHPQTDYSRYPDMVMRPGAMRFEAGGPNVAGICGLAEALAIIEEVRIEAIIARLKVVTDRLAAGLAAAGRRIISPREGDEWSGIVSFDPAPQAAPRVVAALARAGVFVAARRGFVRVSPHWYNSEDQVDRLLAAV